MAKIDHAHFIKTRAWLGLATPTYSYASCTNKDSNFSHLKIIERPFVPPLSSLNFAAKRERDGDSEEPLR